MIQSHTSKRRRGNRRAIGMLEVIICTALVAVMIVPIASVIRASGQAIAQADGSGSTEAELRTGLRWLGQLIRSGDVVSVRGRRLQIQLPSGVIATVRVRRGTLWFDDGVSQTAIAENVRDVRFTDLTQTGPPAGRVGISMSLRARNPQTRAWITVNSTVAIPPQA